MSDPALDLLKEAREYLREIKALTLGARLQDLLTRIDDVLAARSLTPESEKMIREFAAKEYGDA